MVKVIIRLNSDGTLYQNFKPHILSAMGWGKGHLAQRVPHRSAPPGTSRESTVLAPLSTGAALRGYGF